ncbi:FG-GAP repeat protein, partial [Candidatus Uhrbacteria bacterium]|nr:FG-GAP repeat protein [Candidatus Uhrbacteria bacterium]
MHGFLNSILLLSGCETISPFVNDDLKTTICDRDNDTLLRASDYCGGDDCDDAKADVGNPTGWYRDVDGDTYGAGESEPACSQPDGFVNHNGDCDDTDELVNPDAAETCNGYDDNCDGGVDDENITIWYADLDADGYGDLNGTTLEQCDAPDDGYVDNALDCDDTDNSVSPDGIEVCDDDIDQDCNGLMDDADGSQSWYLDADDDGYGNTSSQVYSCAQTVDGYVLDNTDCDDTAYDVSPASSEACEDGVDNDCDGIVDTDAVDTLWYADVDEDGYGDSEVSLEACAPPDGYVGNAEDCDDISSDVSPLAEEICEDGVDNNCDNSPESCQLSGDIDLSDADVLLRGEMWYDNAGWSVAGIGDVNGDGVDDLAVGSPYNDYYEADIGAAYVLFGASISGEMSLGETEVKMRGESYNDNAGWSVAGVGDVNGDGVDDLAVGAPSSDDAATDAGSVYVLFGSLSSGDISL